MSQFFLQFRDSPPLEGLGEALISYEYNRSKHG